MPQVGMIHPWDRAGHARNWIKDWGVYCAVAPVDAKLAMIKIGVSCNPYQRLGTLRTGCPFEIEMTLWAVVGERRDAYGLESALHLLFAPRRRNGEWFEFDMSSAKDKGQFHAGVKAAYAAITGCSLTWKKISPEQVTAYMSIAPAEDREQRRKARLTPGR